MKTLWLLGGLGLGAGLMYLMDAAKGAGRRERIRGYVGDFGRQTSALVDDTRRTLGRQAQAVLAPPRRRFRGQPGLGERLHTQAAPRGMPLGVALVGGVGLGAGLVALLEPQGGPQRRAWLRAQARAYWRTTDTRHAPRQELRRAWRIYQGRDTQRVDAHTRKPAQAEAWYAEPANYESLVLYSEPFVTREEAEAWAQAQDQQSRPWRIYQGRDTQRVDAHTRKPAQAEAWYAEPANYESLVLYSEPFVTREEAEAWTQAHTKQ
jgi:hypothetical protein